MIFITVTVISFVSLLSWLYIFDTYEVKYEFNYITQNSLRVVSIPLNSFGKVIPFRNVDCKYRLLGPGKNIEIEEIAKDEIVLSWKPGNKPEQINIGATNPFSRWENIIRIPIKISEEI